MSTFFERRQPAAVLKHELLQRYVIVFASKTGSQSAGQVTFLDGYAGPGQYLDGTPGSPALAVIAAQRLAGNRTLRCVFVEKDPKLCAALDDFIKVEAADLDVRVLQGSITDHIDAVVADCGDQPLFAFLDPFGLGIPFDTLTKTVLGRSRGGYPKTEVLLNFTVQGIERIGGLLKSEWEHRESTLSTLDETLGGDWWRAVFASHDDPVERLAAIVAGYRERINKAASGWAGWTVPVADKIGARPEYLLLHFTQHVDGVWEFHEALSFATAAWRRAAAEAHPTKQQLREREGQFDLFAEDEPQKPFEEDEDAWIAEIAARVGDILDSGDARSVVRSMRPTFGKALGIARTKHLRAALKLHQDRLAHPPKGKLQHYVIQPKSAGG